MEGLKRWPPGHVLTRGHRVTNWIPIAAKSSELSEKSRASMIDWSRNRNQKPIFVSSLVCIALQLHANAWYIRSTSNSLHVRWNEYSVQCRYSPISYLRKCTLGMSILTDFGKIERTYRLPFQDCIKIPCGKGKVPPTNIFTCVTFSFFP